MEIKARKGRAVDHPPPLRNEEPPKQSFPDLIYQEEAGKKFC